MACPSSMASERKPPELTPSTTFDNISDDGGGHAERTLSEQGRGVSGTRFASKQQAPRAKNRSYPVSVAASLTHLGVDKPMSAVAARAFSTNRHDRPPESATRFRRLFGADGVVRRDGATATGSPSVQRQSVTAPVRTRSREPSRAARIRVTGLPNSASAQGRLAMKASTADSTHRITFNCRREWASGTEWRVVRPSIALQRAFRETCGVTSSARTSSTKRTTS